ncbi:MAG: hypothetical protein KDL10_10595, partial [Kiritimatiellae bacterium]|nr:hypothetical protein [Kiritimatiellia bacterium]
MKSSILIVIFDFFVCSLLLSVTNDADKAGQRTAPDIPEAEEQPGDPFSQLAVTEMEDAWGREYAELEEVAGSNELLHDLQRIKEELDISNRDRQDFKQKVGELTEQLGIEATKAIEAGQQVLTLQTDKAT